MIDPLLWLENQSVYPKVYWESRGKKRIFAAAGEALRLNEIPHGQEGRFYGGISFCDKAWPGYPNCYFFMPKIEMEQTETETHLRSNKPLFELRPFDPCPKPRHREDTPMPAEWNEQVLSYLGLIENNEIEKVVAARRTTWHFEEKCSPLSLLHGLKKQTSHATFFAFQMSPDCAFIGATPEKLYHRCGNQIVCDAMAGTKVLGSALSDKEHLEFGYVKDFIVRTLSPLCSYSEVAQDTVVETGHLQHFCTQFSGTLREGVSDRDLIMQLHPTPAMGGTPQNEALALIKKTENFTRGWYAAPIGWISPEEADIGVGIRSALIEKNQLHLFSAAGIVKGSDPQSEWEELEQKIKPFNALFV